jgi:chromosome segregation ATPase
MRKILLEAVSNINAENSTLGNEILEILNILKFDIKSLPNDIKEEINLAASILKSEGLPSLDETALKLCLEKRNIESKMNDREERLFKSRYNTAFTKYNNLQEKLNQIRLEIEPIEELLRVKMANEENTESDRILWSNKLHDYKDAIKKLELEFDSLEIQEIGLEKTLQKSSVLMDKMNELNELNIALERYGDLPPNLMQAKSMLESKSQELEEIKALIYEKINN